MITQKDLPTWDESQPMPSTKIRAFFKQFPWLKEWTGDTPRSIYAYPISPELLTYEREIIWDTLGDGWVEIRSEEKHLLLDADGKLVEAEGEKEFWETRRYIFFGSKVRHSSVKKITGRIENAYWDRRSLDQVLQALGEKASLVRFVLSEYSATQAFIIYKVPKCHTLLEWIADEQAREEIALSELCDQIDAEGLPARA
jgi:hypothetical protein